MRIISLYKLLLSLILLFSYLTSIHSEDNSWYIKITEKQENIGKYRIYSKNDILFCTGDDPAGNANNKAADLMLAGNFSEALTIIEEGMEHSPLFFPFRYNAGICTLYQNRLKDSLIHFTKASQLAPEYYKTYSQIGYLYGRMNKVNDAIDQLRLSLKKNPRELNTYIHMGDIYFERNQLRNAKKYYEATLSLQNRFPNGVLGLAKIHFKNKEYVKALVFLKSVDISGDYDKSYHYYFAESAFKTRDYKTAVEQYEILLKYKNDRFFLVNSLLLIKHKLELSKKFTER